MDWSIFLSGVGVGAVAIIVLGVILKAVHEAVVMRSLPDDGGYEDGRP